MNNRAFVVSAPIKRCAGHVALAQLSLVVLVGVGAIAGFDQLGKSMSAAVDESVKSEPTNVSPVDIHAKSEQSFHHAPELSSSSQAALFSALSKANAEALVTAVRDAGGAQLRNWRAVQEASGERVADVAERIHEHHPVKTRDAHRDYDQAGYDSLHKYSDALGQAAQGQRWQALATLSQVEQSWPGVSEAIVKLAREFAADDHLFADEFAGLGSSTTVSSHQAGLVYGRQTSISPQSFRQQELLAKGERSTARTNTTYASRGGFAPLSREEADMLRGVMSRSRGGYQNPDFAMNYPVGYNIFLDELERVGGGRGAFIASTLRAIRSTDMPHRLDPRHVRYSEWDPEFSSDGLRLSWVRAFLLAAEGKLITAKKYADQLPEAERNKAQFQSLLHAMDQINAHEAVANLSFDDALAKAVARDPYGRTGHNSVLVDELRRHPDPRAAQFADWDNDVVSYPSPVMFQEVIELALNGDFDAAYARLDGLADFSRSPNRPIPWNATLNILDALAKERVPLIAQRLARGAQ